MFYTVISSQNYYYSLALHSHDRSIALQSHDRSIARGRGGQASSLFGARHGNPWPLATAGVLLMDTRQVSGARAGGESSGRPVAAWRGGRGPPGLAPVASIQVVAAGAEPELPGRPVKQRCRQSRRGLCLFFRQPFSCQTFLYSTRHIKFSNTCMKY